MMAGLTWPRLIGLGQVRLLRPANIHSFIHSRNTPTVELSTAYRVCIRCRPRADINNGQTLLRFFNLSSFRSEMNGPPYLHISGSTGHSVSSRHSKFPSKACVHLQMHTCTQLLDLRFPGLICDTRVRAMGKGVREMGDRVLEMVVISDTDAPSPRPVPWRDSRRLADPS